MTTIAQIHKVNVILSRFTICVGSVCSPTTSNHPLAVLWEITGSFVTLHENTDHLQLFINVEFLAYPVSSMCTEYNGESFKKKNLDHKLSYEHLCSVTTFPESRAFSHSGSHLMFLS